MPVDFSQAHTIVKNIENEIEATLNGFFVERETLIKLLILSAIAREHLLVIGPPGTGKSGVCQRFTELIGGQYFRILLTRFTEPQELLGPINLEDFHKGIYSHRIENMLPTAQIAFLDDIFHANCAILNCLLNILNERYYYEGNQKIKTNLLCAVAASNQISEDPVLKALVDRFLLRILVKPVSPGNVRELLKRGRKQETIEPLNPAIEMKDVQQLYQCIAEVDMTKVLSLYISLVEKLRGSGVEISDRRFVKMQKILATSALYHGNKEVSVMDFWVMQYIWNREDQIFLVQNIVEDFIAQNKKDVSSEIIQKYDGSSKEREEIEKELTEWETRAQQKNLSNPEKQKILQALEKLKNRMDLLFLTGDSVFQRWENIRNSILKEFSTQSRKEKI